MYSQTSEIAIALVIHPEHNYFGPEADEQDEALDGPDTVWPLIKNRSRAHRKAADALYSGKKNKRAQLRVTQWRTHTLNEGKPEQGHHLRLTPEMVYVSLAEAHDPFFDAYDNTSDLEQLGDGPVRFTNPVFNDADDSPPDHLAGWEKEDWLLGMEQPTFDDSFPDPEHGYR